MKFKIMSYEEMEAKMHEEREATYTKMREGEFVGEIPGQYGNVAGGLYSPDMKKVRDPAEAKEKM